MTRLFILLSLYLTITSCDSVDDRLTRNKWVIKEGYFKNQKVEFFSSELLQMADADGNIIVDLEFFKDGSIALPGVNTPDLQAKWMFKGDSLHFRINKFESTIKNSQDNESLKSELEVDSTNNSDDTELLNSKEKSDTLKNDLDTTNNRVTLGLFQRPHPSDSELKFVYDLYSLPFAVYFNGDTLQLKSESTAILAIKYRTVEEQIKKILDGA